MVDVVNYTNHSVWILKITQNQLEVTQEHSAFLLGEGKIQGRFRHGRVGFVLATDSS